MFASDASEELLENIVGTLGINYALSIWSIHFNWVGKELIRTASNNGCTGADLIIIGVEFIEDISFVEMLQENADAFL